MSGTTRSSDGLDLAPAPASVPVLASRHAGDGSDHGPLRRRHVEQLHARTNSREFEQLIEAPDRELLAWITGEADVPPDYDTALFRRLRDFSHRRGALRDRHGAQSRRAPRSRPPADAWQASPTAPRASSLADLARAVAARAGAPATSIVVICRDGAAHGRARARAAFLRARSRGRGVSGLGLPALRPRLAARGLRRPAHDGALAPRARARAATAPRCCSRRSMPRSSACRRATSSPSNRFRSRPATCSPWTASPNGSSSTASCAPRPCASPATMRCAAASSISTRPAWPSRCGSIFSATRSRRSAASIRKANARPISCARSISCRSPNSSSRPKRSGVSASAMSKRSAPPRPTTCSTMP